jgi:hypothetical protein
LVAEFTDDHVLVDIPSKKITLQKII